jgi:hypothetical protein
MNDGWIKLHRKLLDGRIFQDPALLKVWVWCLLRAGHADRWIPVKTGRGETTVHLKRGQFIFGRHSASRDLKLPPSTVRDKMQVLCGLEAIALKSDTHFTIVTIINYEVYQEVPTPNPTPIRHPSDTNKKGKNVKKETTPEISAEISTLIKKILPSPEGQNLWFKTIEAISSTRKTNQVSPSVILGFLRTLERYPETQVVTGLNIYLEKDCAREGKGERYLLGIIRNHKPPAATGPGYPLTGSLLDKYPLGVVQ